MRGGAVWQRRRGQSGAVEEIYSAQSVVCYFGGGLAAESGHSWSIAAQVFSWLRWKDGSCDASCRTTAHLPFAARRGMRQRDDKEYGGGGKERLGMWDSSRDGEGVKGVFVLPNGLRWSPGGVGEIERLPAALGRSAVRRFSSTR